MEQLCELLLRLHNVEFYSFSFKLCYSFIVIVKTFLLTSYIFPGTLEKKNEYMDIEVN